MVMEYVEGEARPVPPRPESAENEYNTAVCTKERLGEQVVVIQRWNTSIVAVMRLSEYLIFLFICMM